MGRGEQKDLWLHLLDEVTGDAEPAPRRRGLDDTAPGIREWGGRPLRLVGGGAVSDPTTPEHRASGDEGVTRQGQNPDFGGSTQEASGLDSLLDNLLGANLRTEPGSRARWETCDCGAERHGKEPYCDACRPGPNAPTKFDRLAAHWEALGAPDQPTYARRFGCPCVCHRGPELLALVEGETRRVQACLARGLDAHALPFALWLLLAAYAQGLAAATREAVCFCPGVPLSLAFGPHSPRPFEDELRALEVAKEIAATGDRRALDACDCQEIRARRALSGLSSTPIPGVPGARERLPGILPPLDPIEPPQGPPLVGDMLVCLCECHRELEPCACACHSLECCMTPDGRAAHEERALAFAGCRCKEHDAQACSSRRAARKAECGFWKEDPNTGDRTWMKKEPCARPGPGIRRPKQKPKTAERKAQRSCAAATPRPPALPEACRCACHVKDCCVADAGERRPHAETQRGLFGACPCTEHDPEACSRKARGPRVLAVKIDTLHLSWHLVLAPEFLALLKEKLQEARDGHKEFVTIKLPGCDGTPWRVHKTGAGRFFSFHLSNEYADLFVSTIRVETAVQLRFELRSAFLWERELEGAWTWCAEIADKLNIGPRCPRSALTRLDMAVDVTGPDFARAIRDDFVMRARKRTRHNCRATTGDICPSCAGAGVCAPCSGTGILPEGACEPEVTVDEHASGLKVSGFSFGHGGIVSRIYDKTREIREKSKEKKWLYLCWAQRGWVATETVWRVEVQLRRESLNEFMGARSLEKLALDTQRGLRLALPSLWAYAVGGRTGHAAWFKWCTPSEDDARRARWDARPEWQVIQRADWARAEPFEVVRKVAHDATFNVLLPQFVGLAKSLAAISGRVKVRTEDAKGRPADGEREPYPSDFEGHLDRYVLKRFAREGESASEAWWRQVNLVRQERNLPAFFLETDEEWAARQRAKNEAKREARSRQLAMTV